MIRADRDGLWKLKKIYGVRGKLLEAVKSYYQASKACV